MCLLVGCLHLCLLMLSPGGLLSKSDSFSQREQGFLGHKKTPFIQGVGRSIDIWQLPTNRKITVNFAHVGTYLQPYRHIVMSLGHDKICRPWQTQNLWSTPLRTHCSNCLWSLYHYLPFIPHTLFVHLNLFIWSYFMIYWKLFFLLLLVSGGNHSG